MLNILHLDQTVFNRDKRSFANWQDACEYAERLAVFRMNCDMNTQEGHMPDSYDAGMRVLSLQQRFQEMVRECPRPVRGDSLQFLQIRSDILSIETRTVKPRLTSALAKIFPKDPPIKVTDKGELISRHDAPVTWAVSEQEPEEIGLAIARAGLSRHIAANRIITMADFSRLPARPNDALGAMMSLALHRDGGVAATATLVTDTDEGMATGIRLQFGRVVHYNPRMRARKATHVQMRTSLSGFMLR